MPDAAEKEKIHGELAKYFSSLPSNGRNVGMSLRQWFLAKNPAELQKKLQNTALLPFIYNNDQDSILLANYWRSILPDPVKIAAQLYSSLSQYKNLREVPRKTVIDVAR